MCVIRPQSSFCNRHCCYIPSWGHHRNASGSHQEALGLWPWTSSAVSLATALLLACAGVTFSVFDVAGDGAIVARHHKEHIAPGTIALAGLAEIVAVVTELLRGVMASTHVACWGDRSRRRWRRWRWWC